MNKVKHNIKEAYKALQCVYEEYPELVNDYSVYQSSVVSNRLFIIDLNEKYDLGVDPVKVDRIDYFKLSNHAAICKYGESLRRTISWSDDNRQPEEGEYLLNISFPTGPYIFSHNDGDKLYSHFNAMFNDIKAMSPKYSDTKNSCLYFTLDKAREVHDEFLHILKKYHLTTSEVLRQIKIDKMESELERLKQT